MQARQPIHESPFINAAFGGLLSVLIVVFEIQLRQTAVTSMLTTTPTTNAGQNHLGQGRSPSPTALMGAPAGERLRPVSSPPRRFQQAIDPPGVGRFGLR